MNDGSSPGDGVGFRSPRVGLQNGHRWAQQGRGLLRSEPGAARVLDLRCSVFGTPFDRAWTGSTKVTICASAFWTGLRKPATLPNGDYFVPRPGRLLAGSRLAWRLHLADWEEPER